MVVRKKKCYAVAVSLLLLSASVAVAEQGDFAAGGKIGTLGLGVEAQGGIYESYYGRVGLNMLFFPLDTASALADYELEMEFINGSLLLDWYPLGNPFRVTAGYFLNNNKIDVRGTPRPEQFTGDYAALSSLGDSARINGTVEFNSASFYAGLGWTNNLQEKGWAVGFDVGVLFQGAASVTSLHFTLPEEDDQEESAEFYNALEDFLKKERSYLETDLDEYKYYPVISCVISYNF